MSAGRRARADQVAQRINAATALLDAGLDVPRAMEQLARRYRLSGRQARRYVERARDEGRVEVPPSKVVFTVKVPGELLRRVKKLARERGQTQSALVSAALEDFVDRIGAGPRGGR